MSDVREFGAAGDGKRDDTKAIEHALKEGDGVLHFAPGNYLITRTIEIPLADVGRVAIDGSGGAAKILKAGPGPAFRLIGTHALNAAPAGFKPGVWQRERMPTVRDIEIEGLDPKADGLLLEGTMQATISGVLLRELNDGIRVFGRCRNILISHCHIYHLRNIGVFFDRLNLHQAIISASHISYCGAAGIKIVGSEIRNLQITGNDIEYNYTDDRPGCADVLIDCTDDKSTVREGTIVSNTIQARYSPGGANVRIVGFGESANHRAGMFTISGNLIGSQETNVHLDACRGVVLGENVIYSGHRRNLLVERSRNIVIGPNSFDHNPDYGEKELTTGIRIVKSRDVQISGCSIQDAQAGENTVTGAIKSDKLALLEVVESERVNVSSSQFLEGTPHGVFVDASSNVAITGCMLLDGRAEQKTRTQIEWRGKGSGNLIGSCRIGSAVGGPLALAAEAGVMVEANAVDGRPTA
jgi:hypothetical protein